MRAHRWRAAGVAAAFLVAGAADAVAQNVLETPEERARFDKIVDDFIAYDVGRLRGGGTASQLRRSRLKLEDWSYDDLVRAVEEVDDMQLLQVLGELKNRKGSIYTHGLAQAIRRVDDDVKPVARGLLATRLARMSDRTLRAKLKSADAEVRAAAATAVGYRGSPLYRELAAALRDGDLRVAQNAHDVLVKMLGDLGPPKDAPGIQWYQASKRWETWVADFEEFVEKRDAETKQADDAMAADPR